MNENNIASPSTIELFVKMKIVQPSIELPPAVLHSSSPTALPVPEIDAFAVALTPVIAL